MMEAVTLYPVAVAAAVTLAVGAASWVAGDSRWTQIVVATGLIQTVGYIFVSRAMFYTSQLLPQQLLFATAAIAITTKIIVFSPGVIARVTAPSFRADFARETLVVGLAGAWLIQASLALLFLFPTGILGDLLLWVLPFSPVSAFVPLFVIGVCVVQVTIASSIYEDLEPVSDESPAPTNAPGQFVDADVDLGEVSDD